MSNDSDPLEICPCGWDPFDIRDEGWITVFEDDWEWVVDTDYSVRHPAQPLEADDKVVKALWQKMELLFICPECGRLLWQQAEGEPLKVFKPELPPNEG